MTGAPKHRTVALLDALEAVPRGVYSGCVGFFSRCGGANLSIVIRTAVIDGRTVRIGTGGAITADSDPAAELDETIAKSHAVLAAFGRTHPLAAGTAPVQRRASGSARTGSAAPAPPTGGPRS